MRLFDDLRVSVANFRKITRQQVVRSLWLGVIIGFLSTLEGRRLAEANLPSGVRILIIERGGHVLVASGETILRVGDRLTISGPRSQSGMVIDLLSGK